MKTRPAINVFAFWVGSGVACGAAAGLLMGLGDCGHVGRMGALVIATTAGGIFGAVGGGVFALLFTLASRLLRARTARVGAGALLGALAGLAGGQVTDATVGIANASALGISLGVLLGGLSGMRAAGKKLEG